MAPDGFHVVGGDENSLRTQVANLMSIIVARERRIAELEAVVVPLERLLHSGAAVNIDIDYVEYCVEAVSICAEWDAVDFRSATLAEALSAAVKAMEDAT